ncbi:MAG: hypothetical protein KGZ82_04330 [Bacteroidales bacterium]|nr:hypothetical protein [Bacteroidales bacterium]
MKRFFSILMILLATVSLSGQVYDGITQPTRFRYWLPLTTSVNTPGSLTAAPFMGYKVQPANWISFTPILQYNFNREAAMPQLWLNVNYQQKYYLLFRSIYDLKTEAFSETVSGTVKLNSYMVDFTWDNLYRSDGFLINDRLQILAGYAWKHLVLNAGYSIRDRPGFVTNARVKLTSLSWLQFRYDSGTDTFTLSTAIHI